MPRSFNKLWIAIGLPAILAAAIGATVAFASDDGPAANDGSSTLLQEEPTPTPAPEETPDDGDSDGTTPEKDCPRDGGSGDSESESSSGAATGVSFRRR